MFGFFKKGPKPEEMLKQIAQGATIDPVLGAGEYIGFLIHLHVDQGAVSTHFKNHDALSSFVSAIEERILANDFDDERLAPSGMLPAERQGKATAKRAVFIDKKPLFSW